MRDGLAIEITYQSFWRDESYTFEIEPYCVKIFKQRWYVLAYNSYYDALRIYSLDRIQNLRVTDTKFETPDFKPEDYFNDSFGIIVDEDIDPCTVEIKAWGTKRKYFHALPLHDSQEEIERADEYAVFRYFIRPTYDFRQELLSHGAEIEVLLPSWFRDEISAISKKMNKLYK
jgi:predicted DNA-binding transcriptional regulator YafY